MWNRQSDKSKKIWILGTHENVKRTRIILSKSTHTRLEAPSRIPFLLFSWSTYITYRSFHKNPSQDLSRFIFYRPLYHMSQIWAKGTVEMNIRVVSLFWFQPLIGKGEGYFLWGAPWGKDIHKYNIQGDDKRTI